MANRFWVGGTANWDATAGTKWATTSGGAGGSAVPTAADDVFFDAASGAVTVTIPAATTVTCRSITCTGYTGTLAFAATTSVLSVGDASGGALTFVAGMTLTLTAIGVINFLSTSSNGGAGWNVTTGGKTMPALTFNGVGGKWVLQDALTATGAAITLTNGTLDTNGKSVTCGSFAATNANTRTITLGASAITLTLQAGWTTSITTGLTMTANTATVTLTSATGVATLGALNYNGLSFTWSPATGSGGGTSLVAGTTAGTITVANVTRTGIANTGESHGLPTITITGTLTVNGNSANNRVLVTAPTIGATATVTAATVTMTNVNIQDITGAGAGNWNLSAITGGSGDCQGNSGITFTSPSDRYAVVAGNWSSTATWSNTSGGAGGTRVPLPQDDVFFDANSGAGTYTRDTATCFQTGRNIDFTGFTGTYTTTGTSNRSHYGSFTLSSGMTFSTSGGATTLAGRGSHTITSAGKTFDFVTAANMQIGAGGTAGGTYTLADAFSVLFPATGVFTWAASATFNSANYAISISNGSGSGCATVAGGAIVNFGTSIISITHAGNGTCWQVNTGTTPVVSAGQATFVIANALGQALGRTFAGGGQVYGTLTYTVANSPTQFVVSGSNDFGTLNIGSARTFLGTAGTTQNVGTLNATGVNFGYLYRPGNYSCTISVPDSAALSLQGDMDFRVRVALDDWTPANFATLIGKRGGTNANQISYEFTVETSGNLAIRIATGAANSQTVSSSPSLVDGTAYWLRVTRRVSDGRVQFFKAADSASMPSSWTQIGSNATNTNAGQDTTDVVQIGSYGPAAGTNTGGDAVGKFYHAQIRNNVLDDGTGIQLDADFTTKTVGANTFTEGSANAATVTITGANLQVGDGRIVIGSTTASAVAIARPTVDTYSNRWRYNGTTATMANDSVTLAATDTGMNALDVSGFGITGDIDVRVRLSAVDWTQNNGIIAGYSTTGSRSWRLAMNATTGQFAFQVSANGTNTSSVNSSVAVSTAIANGVTGWVRVTWRASDGRVQFFTASGSLLNPVAADFTQLGTNQTANVGSLFNTTAPLYVGDTGGSQSLAGTFYAAEIRDGIDGTLVADPRFGRKQRSLTRMRYTQITAVRAIGESNYYARDSTDFGTNYGITFSNWPGQNRSLVGGVSVAKPVKNSAGLELPLHYFDGTNYPFTDVDTMLFTGGTETTINGYRIHTFTGSGTLTMVRGGTVEYLLIAGGGSGGSNIGGGGGAGGVLQGSMLVSSTQAVVIGAGGTATGATTNNGADSTFNGLTAIGGGKAPVTSGNGSAGGSGGGAGRTAGNTGGAGTVGQGNNGANVVSAALETCGGGGGAGAASTTVNGGAGISSSISGTATLYAGGGGAYNRSGTPSGVGGSGIGGNAATAGAGGAGTAGAANTGSGGGGGGISSGAGGAGAAGILIVRYRV